jgi:hypothetical protein
MLMKMSERTLRCVLAGLVCVVLLAPQSVQASPSKKTSCTSCHGATGGTIYTAINGSTATSISGVLPNDSIEIDWYHTGASVPPQTAGVQIAVPTGWTVTAGTQNSPTISGPGWNSAWDVASRGNTAGYSWSSMYTTAGEFPSSPDGYTIEYELTVWNGGKNKGAFDDGSAGDYDGTSDSMGADAIVTVPNGTANGTYQIVVFNIGHSGTTKSYVAQILTVNVGAGGDVTAPTEVAASLSAAPEYTTFVGSPATITMQFNDAESAVTTCEYTLDGTFPGTAGVVSGAGPYSCTASGVVMANGVAYTLQMRATSSGGTSTPLQSLNRTGDTAAPSTTDNSAAGWQSADQNVALTPNDGSGSGTASTEWCIDTANSCTPNVDGSSFGSGSTVNVTESVGSFSTQYVRYRSIDNLGNSEAVNSRSVQIDKEIPVDGLLSVTPADGQLNLSWSAATEGNALASPTYKVVAADLTTTPPADCSSGRVVYSGDATSVNDTGLSNGSDYAYRVCATDLAGNVSTGATGTAQPAAVCTSADPTVAITGANRQITAGSGSVVYNVDVTNNDSAACADTTFALSVNDSNGVDFATSLLATGSLLLAPGTTGNTSLTVTAVASPGNGAINVSSVTSAAAGPHGAVTSGSVTTPVNIATTPTLYYNVGETVHFEFRTANRFAGTPTINVARSDNTNIVSGATMLEVQQGAQWIYLYDWNTTAQAADTYQVQLWDGGDANPTATTSVVLANPTAQINLFADAGYTTPTDIFANGATVYVEVQLGVAETGIAASDIDNYYGSSVNTTNSITQTGTVFRYNFVADFVTAGIVDSDWGYLFFQGADNPALTLHRPIQRNDIGCGSCSYSDPTVNIVTADQAINTDAGSVAYTINVTNNDTVACGSTDFNLTLVDSNGTAFDPSTFGVDPLTVSPGVTGTSTITVTARTGFTSATNGTYFYTAADVNHAQSANSVTRTTTLNVIDLVAPTIDSFSVPATSTSQTVTVSAFTASDNVGVTGYMITESAVAPNAADVGWLGAAPANYTVSSGDGSYTLYAWVKDAQGNVSTSLSAAVDVDSAVPTVTAFTVPTPQGATTVSITTFSASDNIGVTGYKVTESAVAPNAGDAGWTGLAPASYTVSSGDGGYTLYAWAKDAVGNVSAAATAPVTVDTTAPSVSLTVPIDTATGIVENSQVTITWNESIDCATVTAANITSTSPGWGLASCSGSQAVFNTSLQAYNTSYTVNVGSNVRDLTGNAMAALYSFSYTTRLQPCVYSDPTISIAEPSQDITADNGFADYTVTINNNDTGSCGNTTFTLLATENPVTANFTEAFPGASTISLAPGANGNLTVRTTAINGILNGLAQILNIKTDGSLDLNHADSNLLSRTTTMNAPCTTAPTATFQSASQQIASDGGSAAYTVQVQNDNPLACGSTTLTLVAVDDNAASFSTPSVFTVNPLTVNPGGATNSTTLTVTAKIGATNGAVNNSYFYTALNGTIPQSGNSATRTTTINRSCVRSAPSFSHAVNQNIATDGSIDYTLTVINNDVDCAATTFDLGIDSEVESTLGAFTLPSTLSAATVNVASDGGSGSVSFTVTGSGSGSDGDTLTSTLRLSDATNHATLDQTTVPLTTIKQYNPLVHSSLSTASTKHSGDGGWGIVGGKYGEFTCDTCHVRHSSNIKRIRPILPSAPDVSKGNFPGAGGAILFQDATVPATDFGDDSGAPRASSNRICEVCHTYDATRANGVSFHAYDQQVAAGHEDSNDCVNCHQHNSGFSKAGATCDSCHGYPPSPGDATATPVRTDDGFGYQAVEGKGAHVEHVNHLAALSGVTLDPNNDSFGDANVSKVCGVCHDMSGATHEMGGGATANRNINFNGSAAFQFGPAAPAYNGVEDVSSATTPKTCSNISCHFQTTPWWE